MILVVDDNQKFCDDLKAILRRVSTDVLVALSYGKATTLLDENSFNVVVCDLNLGDIEVDGYSLYKKYQSNTCEVGGVSMPTHWIFVSGDPEQIRHVWGLNNSDFILKSDSPYEIVNLVRDILEDQKFTCSSHNFTQEIYATSKKVKEMSSTFDHKLDNMYKDIDQKLWGILDSVEKLKDEFNKNKDITPDDYNWIVMGKVHSFLFKNGLYKIFIFLLVSFIIVSFYLKKFPF